MRRTGDARAASYSDMANALAFVALLAVCGLMLWGSYRIEPHWVSKDGQRFICYAQNLSMYGEPEGRFREIRGAKINESLLELRQKGRYGRNPNRLNPVDFKASRTRHQGTFWNVVAISPDPPPRKSVFVLGGNHDAGQPALIALRLPAKSRAVPLLEELFTNRPDGPNQSQGRGNAPKNSAIGDDI